MINKSCDAFVSVLASASPVPGGGGAAALGGAIGAALGEMVGNLTKGKKKYAVVQDEIERLTDELEKTEKRMKALVQADADVFEPLSKAYGLPNGTEEEKAEKAAVMEEALKKACSVPMNIMEEGLLALHLLKEMGKIGTKIALSDVGVGAVFLKAAIQGAAMNVYTNTRLMMDRVYAEDQEARADELRRQAEKEVDEIYKLVEEELRCQS